MPQAAIANGNIAPSRFIKIDTTNEGRVLQAGAGDRVIGISQAGTRRSDYVANDGFAAKVNEPIRYFNEKDEESIPLELGGTVARGDRVKSDANGKGVTAGTDKDQYGAIAIVSGVSGEIIPVKFWIGEAGI